ncbi:MAG: RHS repeat-associated core domain-containing protein, partial [Flavobacteriales bacterium]|nr:RHS repeat-associated core domain-containing protein [Flavobacteriales bacterium]
KDYILGFEYYEGAMEAVYHESGRIVPSSNSYEYQYHIKDQLGNSRVCFTDKNNDGKIKEDDGEVLQRNHYYPFGADQEGAWSTVIGIKNNYQYNGKEFQNAFGLDWYDYGSRHYDPHLGKWHSIDPKAEDFHEWSPYNYVLNNPIKLIDPDGEAPSNGDDPEPFVSVNKPRTPKGPYLKLSFDVSAGPHTKSGTRMLGIGEKFEAGVSFKVIGAELLIGVTENYLNLRVMNTGEQEIVLGGSHVAAGGSVTLTRTVKDGEITSTAEGKVQAGPIFVKQSSSLDGNSSNNDLTAGFEFFSSSSSLPLASGDGNFFSVNLSASIENISTRIGMQGDAADGYALSYKANRAHVRSRMHARGIDPNDPYGIKAAKRKKAEKEARRKLRAEYYKLTGEWYWGDFPIKK